MRSYGFSKETRPKLNLRNKLALRSDMNELRNQTRQNVSVILNDHQMDEFLEIQEENRKQMRERWDKSLAISVRPIGTIIFRANSVSGLLVPVTKWATTRLRVHDNEEECLFWH